MLVRPTIRDKREKFRKLHESGCFVIPNAWDIGSARYLQSLGFHAIASTSAGFAFAQGLPDNAVSRDTVLGHLRELVESTDLPVNADFENGFAQDPDELAENVRLCVETGVAGLSIEDSTGDKASPLYEMGHSVARIKAARRAIDQSGSNTILVGRAECFLVGRPDIDEVIRRLKAYADAGADCLYAPDLRTRHQISTIVKAVTTKPINILISSAGGMSIADAAALGVRRVSVGGALARVAWGAFRRAAKELAEKGTFGGFIDPAPYAELNAFFREWNNATQ